MTATPAKLAAAVAASATPAGQRRADVLDLRMVKVCSRGDPA
jgi:hypothetical protein